jgi:hypothetical protein
MLRFTSLKGTLLLQPLPTLRQAFTDDAKNFFEVRFTACLHAIRIWTSHASYIAFRDAKTPEVIQA